MAPPRLPKNKPSDTAMRFRVDGVVYTLDRGEVTPKIERELFQQSKMTMAQAFEALSGGGMFGLAGLVFLARRQAGEAVAYERIETDLWEAMRAADGEFDVDLLTGEDDDAGEGEDNPPG